MFAFDKVLNEFEERMQVVFMDMKSMIINRIQTRGTAADGTPFSPYSTRDYLAYKYTLPAAVTGERGARETAKEQVRRQIAAGDRYISYAEYRQLSGYQISYKDFTRSGQFTGAFGVVETGRDAEGYYTWLGFTNPLFSQEYDIQKKREGKEIFEPSEQELEVAAELITEWLYNNIEAND